MAVVLAMTPAGHADSGTDSQGDAAPGYDLQHVEWTVTNTTANLTVETVAALAGSASVLLFLGDGNETEPREWYVLHAGPGGDAVFAGHASAYGEIPAEITRNGSMIAAVFDRVEAAAAPCIFATAATFDDATGGRQMQDVFPNNMASLDQSWDGGMGCHRTMADAEDVHDHEDDAGFIPGFAVWMMVAAVFMVAVYRRA